MSVLTTIHNKYDTKTGNNNMSESSNSKTTIEYYNNNMIVKHNKSIL